MDYSLPPVWMVDNNNMYRTDNVSNASDAGKELVSMFMKQMLKEVFKTQSEDGIFTSGPYGQLFSDAVSDKMIEQLAQDDAFGFNKLVDAELDRREAQ